MSFPILYQIDSKGKVRTWKMVVEGGSYWTVSGLIDGKQVTSDPVIIKGKNIGRSNETTPEAQAIREVQAHYEKKLEKKYYTSLEEAKKAGTGMKFFSPMLCTKWKDVSKKIDLSQGVFVQPKLDGFRCSMSRDGSLSRGGKPFFITEHIEEALSRAFMEYPDLRLDGELYNHDYHDDFDTISSLVAQKKPTNEDIERAQKYVQYHIYDVSSHPGKFSERWKFFIEKILPLIPMDDRIHFVSTIRVDNLEDLDVVYSQQLEDGYEGQIIRLDEVYLNGPKRDKRCVKRKEFEDEEFEVAAPLEPGKGNWAGSAKRVLFKLKTTPDGKIPGKDVYPEAGIKGSYENNVKLLNGPQPTHVTIRYPNKTPNGVPRFPIAVQFFWGERDN